MNLKIAIVLSISILFIGCSSKPKIDIDSTPKMQVPKKVAPIVKRKGTLYSRRGASLFSDKKDLQVGDIIQILIEETLTNDSTNSRSTAKSNSTSLGGGIISPLATVTPTAGGQKRIDKFNKNFGLGFNTTSKGSFSGSSKSAADEEFTTTISAIIEQTYQNGNYFIKGTKEMLINGQKQNIKISGVIRPYDISPENTVYSNQLANLKILYEKDGDENDALEKSWGTKFIETIWPF
ncbi:MAG: flagellar basal body L-ring protein FlgH [Epsilonproteobacteria bacterium]|nr:MAG: flagellar basal body L-ring protein FlgH [Campylobacterota bacterium]